MATVLVVDDAASDRRLITEHLGEDPGLRIAYATNGIEALAQVEQAVPDLVVTDLLMPEMNGLELLAALRTAHPGLPVILTTSGGDEEAAAAALREGAASYVPKLWLARDLLRTVQRVLAASRPERQGARLAGCLVRREESFVIENDAALFGPLVSYLQGGLLRMGICGEADCTRVGVALEEALSNALCHGNLQLDPLLRERDIGAYGQAICLRSHQSPYADRRIYVDARLTRERAAFTLRDEGRGFDPATVPDPTDPANLGRFTGRGILLMRTFMDEVIYSAAANEVTLVKYRGPSAQHSSRPANESRLPQEKRNHW